MEKTIIEIGLLLDGDIDFYIEMLESAGAKNVFSCETLDKYWTREKYDDLLKMTENQIKNSCVRIRNVNVFSESSFYKNNDKYSIQNYKIFKNQTCNDLNNLDIGSVKSFTQELEENGWYLILETFKRDYHFKFSGMKSCLQLQEIDGIGLVLYYDNPDFIDMPLELQRKSLIDELNSYGFNFSYDELGIDKLKTLLTGSTSVSKYQNL